MVKVDVVARVFVAFLLLSILLGCSGERYYLSIKGSAELLENPYPMGYPSSSPKVNRVLEIIKDDNVEVLDEVIEKNYMVYEVRTKSGLRGFIVSRSNISKISRAR